MKYIKLVLAGRTPEQYEFDLAARGWAFMGPESLARKYRRLEGLYEAIGTHDPQRSAVLNSIAKSLGL